jgi:CheY-like chemotaxis protein
MEKVFEPFVQAEGGERQQTGTGLGVAISRDFALLMGGDLSVQSEVDVGSTFTLVVRVELGVTEDVASALDRSPVIGVRGARPINVLVVDDQLDNRTFLRELLSGATIQVDEAEDGQQAVEHFALKPADLIFMDVKMPRMDGVEATRQIRQMAAGAQVPIVMLSASVLQIEGRSVLHTGANHFIPKPFRVNEVWAALERYLPVDLVRATSPEAAPNPNDLSRAEVASLGDDTLRALREAIALGYVHRVPELLAGLGSQHAHAVKVLSHLAEELELEKLNRVLM